MRKLRFLMPIGFLAVIAVSGVVVMLLWNWLMPPLFGLITISFWQALGMFVLCRLLFGGFGGRHKMRHKVHGNPIREKWLKMTPEERREFVKKHHFGHGFRHGFFQDDKSEKQD